MLEHEKVVLRPTAETHGETFNHVVFDRWMDKD